MYLKSLATALPSNCFTQLDCWHAMNQGAILNTLKPRSRELLEKILTHSESGIQKRHFALQSIASIFEKDAQALNQHFEQEAPQLAAQALQNALAKVGMNASQLDALFISTCTGYLCPGVSSYVAELMGMKSDSFLMDVVGLGCGAAVPTLRAAHDYLSANPDAVVGAVSVEICSSAFFIDDDPGVLISLCLFGDGAAATILSGKKCSYMSTPESWRMQYFKTTHQPMHREKIRFINQEGKLKNQLHRSVPELAAQAVALLFEQRHHQPVNQIISHSGGRDVIDAIESLLPYRLDETRQTLQQHGNMSSPSVLFALEKRLAQRQDDQHLWLVAFGAGFSAHSAEMIKE